MKKENQRDFDYKKLQTLIAKKGLTITGVNKALGRNGSYLNDCHTHGGIKQSDIERLAEWFGIKAADYVIPEEPPKVETPPAPVTAYTPPIKTTQSVTLCGLNLLIEALDRQTVQLSVLTERITQALVAVTDSRKAETLDANRTVMEEKGL